MAKKTTVTANFVVKTDLGEVIWFSEALDMFKLTGMNGNAENLFHPPLHLPGVPFPLL